MQNSRTRLNLPGWVIVVGLCYYVLVISLIGLTHEHDHDAFSHGICSACLFSANHLGIEIEAVDLSYFEICISVQPPFDSIPHLRTPSDDVLSRAPPSDTERTLCGSRSTVFASV